MVKTLPVLRVRQLSVMIPGCVTMKTVIVKNVMKENLNVNPGRHRDVKMADGANRHHVNPASVKMVKLVRVNRVPTDARATNIL